jgi:HD-GYP domain-containing protein (c-di-GMP phosphodiesterase class II)
MKTIREFVTPDMIRVSPGDSVWSAVEKMRAGNKTSVLVVADGSPVGIFTERDLFNKIDFSHAVELSRDPVGKYMTASIVSIPAGSTHFEAITLMKEHGFRHLPVTEGGAIIGILSLRNLLYFYTGALENLLDESLESLSSAIGKKDPYTAGHQGRVAEIATAIAIEMGFTPYQIKGIHMAALVHDIGKLYVPTEILSKPGRLAPVEFALIKEHPQASFDILKGIEFQAPIARITQQHHERMDGSGYPLGLKGDEILLEARIIAAADVWEAITSHRPYRASLGVPMALEELKKNAGTHFDPNVVEALLRIHGKIA